MLRAVLEAGLPEDPFRPALDIGCGTGMNFHLLAPWGRFVGSEASGELFAAGFERPDRPVVQSRGEALPFADGSLGLCTFFDVLEHIEREDAFLSEVERVLRPGGFVFLTVPAHRWLWSRHDEVLHHRRRYVRRELADVLERNGFEILRLIHTMFTILPAVAAYRGLSGLLSGGKGKESTYLELPWPLPGLLTLVLRAEAQWLRRFEFPTGTSLFALARKRG
jgi:SAM-dependent methyltransferase